MASRNSKDRILIIMPSYSIGGAEKQMRYIIERLDRERRAADVFVLNYYTSGKDCLLIRDRKRMKHIRFQSFQYRELSAFEIKWKIMQSIQNSETQYSIALLFYEMLIPLIPLLNNLGIVTIYSERREGSALISNREYRECVSECDIITCNSSVARDRIEKELKQEAYLIENGIDVVKPFFTKRKKAIKRILVPCRIHPTKNQMLLLTMMKAKPEAKFEVRFVGEVMDKAYYERLRRRIEEDGIRSVDFIGHKDDMNEEYKMADLVVLPSYTEGTPNVTLESFLLKRPVIVSNIDAERGIVSETHLRFSPDSAMELYECIQYVEKMKDADYEDMLAKHREFIVEKYDIDRMTQAYIDIFDATKTKKKIVRQDEIYQSAMNDILKASTIIDKQQRFYNALCNWVELLQKNRRIDHYLLSKGYQKVSIYGYKEFGAMLKDALKDTNVTVCEIIDQNASSLKADCEIIRPSDIKRTDVDAVIVTAITSYDSIKRSLKRKIAGEVISLETIIGNLS